MKGYLRDPAATRDAFHGDWYVTGDLAVLDADGFLTLTGRLTRFSKIGGEMVPHGKIEHSLMDLDHEHAYAVTGVSDFQKGERLIVVHNHPGLDIETTVRNLRQTGLPNLWVPKMDSFYFVEKLPLLGSGKLDLRALHRLAENLHHGRSVPLSSKPPIGSA
jgi:acyl-[acyl-carrier-protein]-phospholipid O-acyltransferase/long-chain-fatty-acid--[acyl-carrier-protein] ligase